MGQLLSLAELLLQPVLEAHEIVDQNPYSRTKGRRISWKRTWPIWRKLEDEMSPEEISLYFGEEIASGGNHWYYPDPENLFPVFSDDEPVYDRVELNMYHLCEHFVVPLTKRYQCSWVEMVATSEQLPVWFVSQ